MHQRVCWVEFYLDSAKQQLQQQQNQTHYFYPNYIKWIMES